MTKSGIGDAQAYPLPVRRPGLGARLLLAFLVVAAFGALAAASAIYALHQLGDRFDVVDARLPRAVSALELSRSAERIVATAPALLAVADQHRLDQVGSALDGEARRLLAILDTMKASGADLPLAGMEPMVAALAEDLATLGDLVARRLSASERIVVLRRAISDAGARVERLLAPWIAVVESEIGILSVEAGGDAPVSPDAQARLAAHLTLQRNLRSGQVNATSIVEMLGEASTSEEPGRLKVLAFQVNRALDDLASMAEGFDPRLRAILLRELDALRSFANSPDSVLALRREELQLLGDGLALVDSIGGRSAELTAAVDRLGAAATEEIGTAIEDAVLLQERSTWLLALIAVAAVLASVLIVWLFVGRNVVRRLNALSDRTRAIAGGDLNAEVSVEGADEITAMARAVEKFRINTLERDGLLIERAQAADRLEEEVQQRTAQLSRSMLEIEEKSRALESVSRFKSRFLASASHDLRQPLHALNLFVSQLHDEREPAERERLLGRIGAAVGSMNDLFDALLDMAKLDAGVIEPNVQRFAIEPLLSRLRTTFSEAAGEKGLKLGMVGRGAWVASDPILLERLLINLVSNAVRYTATGGVVVGCRKRGKTLRIEVWDTGVGIREEDQTKILGEFVQLAPGGTGPQGGLGLGLSIVARLADLLDHRLEIGSRVGKGSRFTIVLPLTEERELTVPAPAMAADVATGRCVLVVDDDPLALDGMSGILRSWGCKVIAASSSDAARLALAAQRSKPDLIISDLHLGNGQTGIKFIEDVRADGGIMIPAFLISGDTTPDRLREVQAQGYNLLHKPVAPLRLRAMVNRMMRPAAAPDGVLRS